VYATTNTSPAIPGGQTVKFKFSDVGSFYAPNSTGPATPVPNPIGVFMPQAAGNELRNVFNVTQIFAPSGNPIPTWNTSMNQQLNGLIWGLQTPVAIPSVPYDPINGNAIYLSGNGRNPATMPIADAAHPLGYDITGVTGARFQVYMDGTGALNSVVSSYDAFVTNGPANWIEGTGGPLGPDKFPSINMNGEQLWLDCVFIPYPDQAKTGVVDLVNNPLGLPQGLIPDGTLLRESVIVGSGAQGNGKAWLMIVGGSGKDLFQAGGYNPQYITDGGFNGTGVLAPGVSADIFVSFNVGPNNTDLGAPAWGNWSEDPALLRTLIPEPVTLLGLLIGGGSLGGYLRRRRMA
jgi:hypothetical protein